jgi:hypothetical protein
MIKGIGADLYRKAVALQEILLMLYVLIVKSLDLIIIEY